MRETTDALDIARRDLISAVRANCLARWPGRKEIPEGKVSHSR
jgi:hypothetical protein